jgi:hypothetical protein
MEAVTCNVINNFRIQFSQYRQHFSAQCISAYFIPRKNGFVQNNMSDSCLA